MTMVIGMHLGACILIVADTRVTYFTDGEEPRYEDRRSKIYRTRLGVISGAGGIGLIDAVRIRLSGPEGDGIRVFEDIHRIIDEEHALRAAERHGVEPLPAVDPAQATWLFSYYNPAPDPTQQLRIGIMTAGDPRSRILLGGESEILFPSGTPQELAEEVSRALEENMRFITGNIAGAGEELQHNIQLARVLMRLVAARVPGVSPDSYQIGLSTHEMGWCVTGLLEDATSSFNLTLQPFDAPWPVDANAGGVRTIREAFMPAMREHLRASLELESALSEFVEEAGTFANEIERDSGMVAFLPTAQAMRDAAEALATFQGLVGRINQLGASLLNETGDSREVDARALPAAISATATGAVSSQRSLAHLAETLRGVPRGQLTHLLIPIGAALTALLPLIQAYVDSLAAFRRAEAQAEQPGES